MIYVDVCVWSVAGKSIPEKYTFVIPAGMLNILNMHPVKKYSGERKPFQILNINKY